jgi:glycosyltransferase involved in cell wall biosynthesis
MRLLYYSPAMNELVGAGTHARGLVHGFHALGHDVMTVPELTPDEFVRSTPGRYSRVPDPVKRPARELRGRLAAARRGKELVSAAAAFEPDMVVARRYSYDLLLDRLVASLPVPVIAEVNAVLSIEVEGWGERLTAAEQRRERRFLANAQRLVCVSAEVAASVVDFGVDASDLRVVHNGFDDATFHSRVKPDPATVRWAEGFENVVGYCGTATNHHDMETLVDAAGRLIEEGLDVGFLFVGLTPEQVETICPAPVGRRSRAVGSVTQAAAAAHLAAADVLWAAFRYGHVSPLKLPEYLALGKSVVVAVDGVASSVVTESGGGLVVEAFRPDMLAEAAARLLRDPEGRQRRGEAGAAWVQANASWTQVAARMLVGLERVAKSS